MTAPSSAPAMSASPSISVSVSVSPIVRLGANKSGQSGVYDDWWVWIEK